MNLKVSNKISYLYFILSLMIMILHIYDLNDFGTSNHIYIAIDKYIRIICNMAVGTFFFISAILFYRNINEKKYKDVLKKKTISLLIPYLLWNVIYMPFKIIKAIYIEKDVLNLNFLDIIYNILMSKWNPVLWFIRVLFVLILIYPIIKFLIKRKFFCPIIICLIYIIANIIGPTKNYSETYYWLPTYMLGAYLVYWKKQFVFKKEFYKKYLYILVFILFVVLIISSYYSEYVLYLARMISPIIIWILGDIFLVEKKPYWWMKQTFYYFCVHLAFAEIIRKLYILIVGVSPVTIIFSFIILPIILYFVVILSAYMLRLIKPVWYILNGGRKNE